LSRRSSVCEEVAEAVTGKYGDFKFDNLDENSGDYTLSISYKDHGEKTLDVNLTKSVNIGTIMV
jgi:hypothetical protein